MADEHKVPKLPHLQHVHSNFNVLSDGVSIEFSSSANEAFLIPDINYNSSTCSGTSSLLVETGALDIQHLTTFSLEEDQGQEEDEVDINIKFSKYSTGQVMEELKFPRHDAHVNDVDAFSSNHARNEITAKEMPVVFFFEVNSINQITPSFEVVSTSSKCNFSNQTNNQNESNFRRRLVNECDKKINFINGCSTPVNSQTLPSRYQRPRDSLHYHDISGDGSGASATSPRYSKPHDFKLNLSSINSSIENWPDENKNAFHKVARKNSINPRGNSLPFTELCTNSPRSHTSKTPRGNIR